MSSFPSTRTVLPAQLASLTIYNPAFGDSDETAFEQIFYHYSAEELEHDLQTSHNPRDGRQRGAPDSLEQEHQNEILRQVGLARGMVEFANNFSRGSPVDSIETEKSRIVLHELEGGWWVLASIDLTRIPSIAKQQQKSVETTVEYSSREVAPATLLISQLKRAHSIFLLHHAASLNDLLPRLGRPAFSAILQRYWTSFSKKWDVLLHANPVVDIYNGMKLAGGGELGIGVGEEEWGSGEREVLEDYVRRTDGLTDLIVGRYGDAAPGSDRSDDATPRPVAWLGTGNEPRPADGIVFSGTGALSRRSLATVSQWMEAIFTDGNNAYGIGDNPSSRPRARRKPRKPSNRQGPEKQHGKASDRTGSQQRKPQSSCKKPRSNREADIETTPPGIPPPIVSIAEQALSDATAKAEAKNNVAQSLEGSSSYFAADKMVSYLKLGYGSSWTLNPKGFSTIEEERQTEAVEHHSGDTPSSTTQPQETDPEPVQEQLSELDPVPETSETEDHAEEPFVQRLEQSIGRFLIGLPGDLENAEFEAETNDRPGRELATDTMKNNSRIFMRTLTIRLESRYRRRRDSSTSLTRSNRQSTDDHDKLRVAVYIHQPFIFIFLFELQTASLTMPSFYRSIHHRLGPLQKPLLRSTDPRRIPDRLIEVLGDKANQLGTAGIYDLIYDPAKFTIRTSIPNIPLPGTLAAEGLLGAAPGSRLASARSASGAWYTLGIPIGASSPNLDSSNSGKYASDSRGGSGAPLLKTDYTRLDALNIHSQLIASYSDIHSGQEGDSEYERTVKTSRGWWVVWMRYPINPGQLTRGEEMTPSASTATSPGGPFIVDRLARERREGERPDVDGRGSEIEAFLVRKAVDPGNSKAGEKGRSSGSGSKWLLGVGGSERGDGGRSVSGASAGSSAAATTSARGVVEGMGIDARKWVQGLVRLSV